MKSQIGIGRSARPVSPCAEAGGSAPPATSRRDDEPSIKDRRSVIIPYECSRKRSSLEGIIERPIVPALLAVARPVCARRVRRWRREPALTRRRPGRAGPGHRRACGRRVREAQKPDPRVVPARRGKTLQQIADLVRGRAAGRARDLHPSRPAGAVDVRLIGKDGSRSTDRRRSTSRPPHPARAGPVRRARRHPAHPGLGTAPSRPRPRPTRSPPCTRPSRFSKAGTVGGAGGDPQRRTARRRPDADARSRRRPRTRSRTSASPRPRSQTDTLESVKGDGAARHA